VRSTRVPRIEPDIAASYPQRGRFPAATAS
jgi:hypothetical protein